jgi:hypothetical protein
VLVAVMAAPAPVLSCGLEAEAVLAGADGCAELACTGLDDPLGAMPGRALDAVEAGFAARTGLRAGVIELSEEMPPIIIVFPPSRE